MSKQIQRGSDSPKITARNRQSWGWNPDILAPTQLLSISRGKTQKKAEICSLRSKEAKRIEDRDRKDTNDQKTQRGRAMNAEVRHQKTETVPHFSPLSLDYSFV